MEKVSQKKEETIWKQGIKDWQDFLKAERIKGIPPEKKASYNRKLKQAQEALIQENSAYFIPHLPKKERWRLYTLFKDECGFLDLEIDSFGKVILVGISDYYSTNTFVKGVNLEKSFLEKELSKFKLLVTFNGASFDLPKLKKQLQVEINLPHIDLKPLCVNLGLSGGLKEIETALNLKRPPHLKGNPVELWKAFHASGDREYLELLLDYNKEDVENLKTIMEHVYSQLSKKLYKQLK